jgi:hypothetical protein
MILTSDFLLTLIAIAIAIVMTTLTGAPPVSTAFAGPMSLALPPVSKEIYDDVKLLVTSVPSLLLERASFERA